MPPARKTIPASTRPRVHWLRLLLCVLLLSAPFFAGCGSPFAPLTPVGPVGLVTQVVFSPVTLASAVYASGRDERSLASQADDAALRAAIRARLRNIGLADNMRVSIYAYTGIVFITGELNAAARAAATDIVRRTDGVRHVYTHWFEEKSGDLPNDIAIGTRLRASMIADLSLSSTQIDTYTCGGNVLLLGMVRSAEDARRAESLAQSTAGVRSVKSYLLF